MPSSLALAIWFFFLLGLLRLDPARDKKTSPALWVPVLWMFILGSRLPSQWLGGQVAMSAQAFEEGNPLDRTTFSILMVLALIILFSRAFQWGDFLRRNVALTVFLLFALLSACWSDYPLITFRHWFRDLGNYLIILVVLSDPRPEEAVKIAIRRLCFLLIPLSIVILKYYPAIGTQYDAWTGVATYAGAATSKNMLGVACLISGIFFFWDIVTRWPDRKKSQSKRIIAVDLAFLLMTFWLLNLSRSATSTICLALASVIVAAAHGKAFRHRPNILKRMVPVSLCLCVFLVFVFNIDTSVARAVGRDPTLTDRTVIWQAVLSLHTNPLLGTGYDSFWLGPRLQQLWQIPGVQGVNEAHNGYLEIYLNLGLIGLFLLVGFLVASYRTICKKLRPFSDLASLSLALWTIMLFYSVTEAGFKGGLIWVAFLLGAVGVRQARQTQASNRSYIPEFHPAVGTPARSDLSAW